jgi:threonine dehydrogenase-like Zn-dependent dehydrogenase
MTVPAGAPARTRRRLVVEAPGKVAVHERARPPQPGPGQVRLRLEGCGVCGSDLALWQGRPWFDYPREPGAPGHEGWGVVDALGPDVVGVEEGVRVAALTYHAYSDHDIADADAIVPLPPQLDGEPFPGEALGCAVNVARRSAIEAGMRVAVLGVGFLGALLVQLAARAGAEVIAVSRRAFALEIAKRVGAAHALPLDEHAIDAVGQVTGGDLCDRVIEVTGRQEALDVAGPLTRTRGRLVIAGFHQDGERSVDMQLWNWRGLDVVNAHERERAVYVEGIAEAARLVAAGELDPRPLYTHRFPLERLEEALDAASERPDGFLKALVLT